MQYTDFGRTGVQVSRLCLGTMMFGGRTDEAESLRILDAALDAGVTIFDTAAVYSKGRSEEIIGRWLREGSCRDRIVLCTKAHAPIHPADPDQGGNRREHIIESCEASLRRLQTDRIDLYQLHRPSSNVPIDETLRALDDLVRSGKVRYFGTSTFAAWQITESLWASDRLGLARTVSEQPPYHLLDRRVERELLPMARTYGIAVMPWSPLAGGFLTGKYRDGEAAPPDARFDHETGRGGVHFTEAAHRVVSALREIGDELHATPSQVALAWCASRPGVVCPVIGPRTVEQLHDNVASLGVTLTDAHEALLDEVAPPGRAIVPYYKADFGPHQHRWR